MADGKVIRAYLFYKDAYVIEVEHDGFIARYAEVAHSSVLVEGKDTVRRGQKLAAIGKLTGIPQTMLHLELYATTQSVYDKDLTQKGSGMFGRRGDLIDPSDSIDQAVME